MGLEQPACYRGFPAPGMASTCAPPRSWSCTPSSWEDWCWQTVRSGLLPPEWFCKLPRPGALCPEMLAEAPVIPTCSQEEAQPAACAMSVVLPPSLATEPTESLRGEAADPRSHSVFSPAEAVPNPGSLLAPLGHLALLSLRVVPQWAGREPSGEEVG